MPLPWVTTDSTKNLYCLNIANEFDSELAKYLTENGIATAEMALEKAKEYTLIARVCGMEYDVREIRHLLLLKIEFQVVKYSEYSPSPPLDHQLRQLGSKKAKEEGKGPC